MVQTLSAASLMALASMLGSAHAHMIMKTPFPFGSDTLNNSPLDSSGSDFPCKQRPGVYAAPAQQNVMVVGEPQTLSFTGSAVHGGGSCQISLTTDKEPNKDSKWQVIHSIQGGCPATAEGNLGNDPNGSGASQFQFTIPEGFQGDYVLAWTWFNKIGNREMYMNCAPITVTGAKKRRYAPSNSAPKAKRDGDFPAMAIANLAGINSCKTDPPVDPDGRSGNFNAIEFGQPGSSLQVGQGPFMPFTGTGCPFIAASGGSGASSASSAIAGSSATPPTSTAQVSQSAPENTPGTATTVVASATAPGVFATSTSDASASTGASASPSSVSTNDGGGNATANSPCTQEGATQCAADGLSYIICASGNWVKMPVAAGTKCTGTGIQANLNIVATNVKRHSHAHEHLHRRDIHG